MRIYIDLIHTIAIEVDHDEYEATSDEELLDAIRHDGDFAERFGNGPHATYEADWEVKDIYGGYHLRELDERIPMFETLSRLIPIERRS